MNYFFDTEEIVQQGQAQREQQYHYFRQLVLFFFRNRVRNPKKMAAKASRVLAERDRKYNRLHTF